MKDHLEALIRKINKDPELKKSFKENPEKVLKAHDINPDDLTPEMLKKVSGGLLLMTALGIARAITGIAAGGATAANEIDQMIKRK